MSESDADFDKLVSGIPPLRPKHWRQVVKATKVHKRRYAALLRAKAFQPHKFTENAQYQRGRSVLQARRDQLKEEISQIRLENYRKLLGKSQKAENPLLSRSLLLAHSTQSTLKLFRRPFGGEKLLVHPVPCRVRSPPRWSSSAANLYVASRREQMLAGLNKSRYVIAKTDTMEILAALETQKRQKGLRNCTFHGSAEL